MCEPRNPAPPVTSTREVAPFILNPIENAPSGTVDFAYLQLRVNTYDGLDQGNVLNSKAAKNRDSSAKS
jgi:hypothetical protein